MGLYSCLQLKDMKEEKTNKRGQVKTEEEKQESVEYWKPKADFGTKGGRPVATNGRMVATGPWRDWVPSPGASLESTQFTLLCPTHGDKLPREGHSSPCPPGSCQRTQPKPTCFTFMTMETSKTKPRKSGSC